MTTEKKVAMLRSMMGGDDEDSGVLEVYLELAGNKILNRMYPYKENFDGMDVPDKYVMLQLKISCYMLGKRGAEGEIQHIENGIHRNYGDADIPESMLSDIIPFAQAIR